MRRTEKKRRKIRDEEWDCWILLESCRRLLTSEQVIAFYEKERVGGCLVSDRLVFLAAGHLTSQ